MIKTYLKSAIRNFWRHKLFTLINIVGLSVGISAALVIYLVVHFDFTFDKFHHDGNRIYRVVTSYTLNGNLSYSSASPIPLADAAKKEANGVETAAPFETIAHLDVVIPNSQTAGTRYKEQDDMIYADERYFNMFNYHWLAGSAKTALTGINQVVLTAARAKLYFPNLSPADVVGKTIIYDRHYDQQTSVVTGIVEQPLGNTDLAFHDFISYNTFKAVKTLQYKFTDWYPNTNLAWDQYFIKTTADAGPISVEKQLNSILKAHTATDQQFNRSSYQLHLQPLADMHFDSRYGIFYNRPTANKPALYGLIVTAIMLLLLGCINFINLTTAQATQRAKEIGIRKTLGSSRKQLVCQFMLETFCITLMAVIISAALTPVLLKAFAAFTPPGLKANFANPGITLFLLGLTIIVSLLAGFYPAKVLSGYKTLQVLKNQSGNDNSQNRNSVLRKTLTVTQFVIAQFFVMSTVLVSKQVYYALNKNLGYKKDAILIIETPWQNRSMQVQYFFRNKLMAIPQVKQLSMGIDAPASNYTDMEQATYNDGKKEIKTDVLPKFGDENYTKIYHLKLLKGRILEQRDTLSGMLINETYAKAIGFKNPADAIGKAISFHGEHRQVVGVLSDFHQSSLHDAIKPVILLIQPGQYFNRIFHIALNPQTAPGDWEKAIAAMNSLWKQSYPEQDFDYHFFDENIAGFYESEQRTSTLLSWATALSIIISCLGLLGLAIYTTNQRTKEIGIRKVIGASVSQMVVLLSRELALLILVAFVVVTPIAWLAMNKWMQSFADRTPISWWIFAASGGGMLVVAIITSSFQTVKAAIANPIKSLKSE
jgi:ABC-type antimicrobial peptide transport system permease subunit